MSLNLRDNEFVAILGPSGSGKTTLLNIIGGLDRYDSGDLIINGISTQKYKDRDWDSYRNHTIGFVFQSYNLIPHQSVLANVELALTISGIGKSERRRRATEALEKVGLGKQLHKRPSQMSGGQMQRVAIARALVNDPDILLADEPTGALDSDTSVQVMDLLQEVAKDRLVVMVTHNPELAEQYATRIVTLRDGKIRSDTDPYEVDETQAEPPKHKNMGKSSMSFLTALALSFNNLKTKKARTLLTAFAGSIGIIGIALILSLSNGVNEYIQNVEEETLSEYPLQIQSTGFDITSMMVGNASEMAADDEKDTADNEDGKVKVMQLVTNMFSTMDSNDLKSLKEYLDEGKSGIEKLEGKLIDGSEFTVRALDFRRLEFGNKPTGTPNASVTFDTSAQPIFHKNFDLVAGSFKEYLEKGYTLYICSDSMKQTDRIRAIFEDRGDKIKFTPVERTVHEGFVDNTLRLCIFTDHQLFDRFHKYNLKSEIGRAHV